MLALILPRGIRHEWLVVVLALIAVTAGCTKRKPDAGAERQGPSQTAAKQQGTFEDRASEVGINFKMHFLPNEQGETFKINLYDHGCGVVIGDYDGDGDDDIYFLNQLGSNSLYRNRGNGTFEDVTEEAGVAVEDRICVAGTFADFDNDLDQDLFVTSTRGGNILFENMGNGKFRDVTQAAGLNHIGHSGTAAFVDWDNDGYLDLILTNTAQWTLNNFDETFKYYPGIADFIEFARSPKEANICYQNNRDGTFTDVTEKLGLAGKGWGGDIGALDYNDDGRLDLLITNMFGASQLYENHLDGPFIDVTKKVLGKISWGAIGCKPFDFNNDGKLDLFISDMHSDMWAPVSMPRLLNYAMNHDTQKHPYVTGAGHLVDEGYATELERKMEDDLQIVYDDVVFGNTLYKNLGGGRFEEISDKAKMESWWPWAIVTGDFDGDGWEDVFLPSGMGYPFPYWHNQLMMNNGNETFTDRASLFGIEPPPGGPLLNEKIADRDATKSSRCAAVADFDGDGRLEIVTNNFNDRPYYFQNRLSQTNYVAFKLQGSRSNRDAIGAIMRLYIGDEVMTRQVHPAGGYLSQSSKTLHFGLGKRVKVDRGEITWPSGLVQMIDAPKINSWHAIVEPTN